MRLEKLLQPRICELGKIKIGGKEAKERPTRNGGTWRAPMKLDHFVITTLNRDSRGDLLQDTELMSQLVQDGFGDQDGQLRRLPIHLLTNEIEDSMQAAYCWYGGKTIGARSDGTTITWFNDPTNGKKLDQPREEDFNPAMLEYRDGSGNRLLKLHTVFNCVIASPMGHWGGVYKFRTTSRITADQLYGSLIHLQELTGGVLAGMPLQLVVRPLQVSPEGKPTTVYVVHVELRGSDMLQIQRQAMELTQHQVQYRRQIQCHQVEYRKLLAPPGTETDPRDIDDIEGEFHPPPADSTGAAPVGANRLAAFVQQQAHPEVPHGDHTLVQDEPPPVDVDIIDLPPEEDPI